MLGVGQSFAVHALEVVGFLPFTSVAAQRDPDPEFPTVSFPNPEEKGTYPVHFIFGQILTLAS